ncbi:hypothetical protein AMATHDRAFT_189920 [Amanita thiersii Skay4041]|uniref:Tubulin-specific chaperone A n=1 Tax=Amanita thiersii Skay4041 TaxID=703135 RepID=A0A2A9NP39_9AGAR|nr:hypothetical protein AMATHDRAFT_189920 [Amanita thiersii Skay4041]
MNASAVQKQLNIKLGAVKRLSKEHDLYKEETEQHKTKHDQLVKDGSDEWDVKNAMRMHEESSKMITDSRARLNRVIEEIQDLVESAKKYTELDGSDELSKAKTILQEVKL